MLIPYTDRLLESIKLPIRKRIIFSSELLLERKENFSIFNDSMSSVNR